jgi:hypothetical protein
MLICLGALDPHAIAVIRACLEISEGPIILVSFFA